MSPSKRSSLLTKLRWFCSDRQNFMPGSEKSQFVFPRNLLFFCCFNILTCSCWLKLMQSSGVVLPFAGIEHVPEPIADNSVVSHDTSIEKNVENCTVEPADIIGCAIYVSVPTYISSSLTTPCREFDSAGDTFETNWSIRENASINALFVAAAHRLFTECIYKEAQNLQKVNLTPGCPFHEK
jgi:hypothetical protein